MPQDGQTVWFQVPVVRAIAATGQDAHAALVDVAVGRTPPPHYRLDSDIGLDFAAIDWLHRDRGEWPAPAWLVAPTAAHDRMRVEGASCGLGLALASACAHLAVRPVRPIVATGTLQQTGIGPVNCLFTKLRAAACAAQPGALVLVPAAGLAESLAGDDDLAALYGQLHREGRVRAVASFEAALAVVLDRPAMGPSNGLMALRERLEQVRLDQGKWSAELAPAATALVHAARALLPAQSPALAMMEILAMTAVELGSHVLQLQPSDLPWLRWPDGPNVAEPLATQIDARLRHFRGELPIEIVATVHNLRAAAAFRTFEFGAGLRHADRGLNLPGLSQHPAGEYRRLLGTRAQLHTRQALRLFAAGLGDDARFHAQAGLDDAEAALRAAPAAMQANDRARVVTYLVFAQVVAQQLGVWSGPLHRELADAETAQGSAGWVRDVRWLALRACGQWSAIADERLNFDALDAPPVAKPGQTLPLNLQPCDVRALATLTEACLQLGQTTAAAECLAKAARLPEPAVPPALTLARWWPVCRLLVGPHDGLPPPLGWLADWFQGDARVLKEPAPAPGLLGELLQRWQVAAWQHDWRAAEDLRNRVLLWHGEPAGPPWQDPQPSDQAELTFQFVRGRTQQLAELPEHAIALDGAVRGPAFEPSAHRYSFDHHGPCIRHATLATCEMVRDALRVGLWPHGYAVVINDLDADSILSAWLLRTPGAAADPAVVHAVGLAGRRDALGPAAGYRLPPTLAWALQPAEEATPHAEPLAQLQAWFARLDTWWQAGAPLLHPDMAAPTPAVAAVAVMAQGALPGNTGRWALASCSTAIGGLASLYQMGFAAGLIATPLADGTVQYAIGKRSEFVSGFDVPHILQTLAAAEIANNPGQDAAHNWGGGSTVGGSPRNPDGSASRLPTKRVVELLAELLGTVDQ